MHRMNKGSRLDGYGVIAPLFERIFRLLQQVSSYAVPVPASFTEEYGRAGEQEQIAATKRRMARIDAYICVWLLVELIVASLVWASQAWLVVFFARMVAVLRIVDIVQVGVNMAVFNQLRLDGTYYMASTARSLILTVVNYCEFVVCFGIVYATALSSLTNNPGWIDAFYFSCVTQLTIGYGDISPLRTMRLVACVQGMIGVLFGILILSRFVALLPGTRTILRENRPQDEGD